MIVGIVFDLSGFVGLSLKIDFARDCPESTLDSGCWAFFHDTALGKSLVYKY